MGLFWYPEKAPTIKFGEFDKQYMIDKMVAETLDRLQSLFIYEGLPEEVPAKWLEHYLMTNGTCIFTKLDNGKYYALVGNPADECNAYYVPLKYVVANPWIKLPNGNTLSKEFITEDTKYWGSELKQDCVLLRNDTYAVGLLPMIYRYCKKIVENDITMELASILARATINISAADDRTKASAEVWLKNLIDGKLGIMSETAFIEGLNVREFKEVADCLIPLIEYHQYTKASFLNDIGLNANYNMKREAINSNESNLNDDMLKPFIDDMLKMREEAIEEINKKYDLNISVSFNSAWASNEIEEEAELDKIEAEAEALEAEAGVVEEASEEPETEEAADNPETEEAADDPETEEAEDVNDETEENEDATMDTEEALEEEPETEEAADDIEALEDEVEALEDEVEALEDKVDALEDDEGSEDDENEDDQ